MSVRTISGERVVDLTRATDPDWYRDHENLAALYRWLRDRAQEPYDVAYFMEKPWKWQPEWDAMWKDLGEL